jgi:hypothetical protein
MPWDQPLAELKAQAVHALHVAFQSVADWVERVRPEDGIAGRFCWAVKTSRAANVAATHHVLSSLKRMGLFQRLITEADQRQGLAWVEVMHDPTTGRYQDPALLDRPSPRWPEDAPWPSPDMLASVDQHARGVLKALTPAERRDPERTQAPPPGCPQPHDPPESMVAWIKDLPYRKNAPWACTHAQRMLRWMLRWHEEGRFGADPLVEAIAFLYSIQDPRTGLWGTSSQPWHKRVAGVFKLLVFLRERLDLPIPGAEHLIDGLIARWASPEYDRIASGGEEWQHWYIMAHLRPLVPEHRGDEVERLAAYRIVRSLETFAAPDGGLKYLPEGSLPMWHGFDMVPEGELIDQGDAQGLGILSAAICVCVDLLALSLDTPWTGQWRLIEREDDPVGPAADVLRSRVIEAVPELADGDQV